MKKLAVFLIIAGQLLFLSSMIWFHQAKLSGATKVLLKTVPVDPQSVFRGYFVDLNYEISSLPKSLLQDADPAQIQEGQELFVVLKKDGQFWQAESVQAKKPQGKNIVFIRGRTPLYWGMGGVNFNFEYGIESFFLNEESAHQVEESGRGDWGRTRRLIDERIAQLDEETKRIYDSRLSDYTVDSWEEEMVYWVRDGLVSEETMAAIIKKYRGAFAKIDEATRVVNESVAQPLSVEVAIDKNGYGYPVKLWCEGREYR